MLMFPTDRARGDRTWSPDPSRVAAHAFVEPFPCHFVKRRWSVGGVVERLVVIVWATPAILLNQILTARVIR
jgi:hypothetical protein